MYNALYDAPLRNVLTAHEQGAIHAADGYARASGRTGVCIATSGPGATNIVTGLATAYLDSVPLVSDYGTGFCCKFRQRLFSGNRYCRCDIADNEI